MSSEVIVCTKDRPVELRRCLDALARQSEPADRIVVIDSSVRPCVLPSGAGGSPIVHLTTPPGLTRQRNIGLRTLLPGTMIVHFLDDDAVPEHAYLSELNDVFRRSPDAVGATARITNLPQHRPWALERAFMLNSRRQGALLRSGINIFVFDGEQEVSVDWLSGCCMSYRLDAIRGMQFDEARRGGGLGEDVDFSARAAGRGRLLWSPRARTAHLQSMIGREPTASVMRRNVRSRWQLAAEGIGGVTSWCVIYATIGAVIVELGRMVHRRSFKPGRVALAAVWGLIDVLRGRPV